MSESPSDLLSLRAALLAETGLPVTDIGIAADEHHLSSGGYHCGGLDLYRINAVGRNDYSIRQPRDRAYYDWEMAHGSNWASAMDLGDDWPRGGRAAWLRFNNLMRAHLGNNDPALAAVRGMNYSPDGTRKRRFDHLTNVETSSADTVTWHTHIEWWRDTIAQASRRLSITRIVQIAIAARDNALVPPTAITPPAPIINQGEDMLVTCTDGSGSEKSVNGLSVPANGRGFLTPGGFYSFDGSEVGGFDTSYWKNTPQMKWANIKIACDALKQPLQLSDSQLGSVTAAAGKGAHDAINGATGTLTLSAADNAPHPL